MKNNKAKLPPSEHMTAAVEDLQKRFPGKGITLFVFDFGPKGNMSYASNAQRVDMVSAIVEWLERQLDDNITHTPMGN